MYQKLRKDQWIYEVSDFIAQFCVLAHCTYPYYQKTLPLLSYNLFVIWSHVLECTPSQVILMFMLSIQQEKAPLMPVDVRSESVGEECSNKCLGFISTSDTTPPPIPPPPVNYQGGPFPRVSGLLCVLSVSWCAWLYRWQLCLLLEASGSNAQFINYKLYVCVKVIF
jgi:hypothetical protein